MKGFTLIELLIVVLIIGILAAIALPNYQIAVDKAKFVKIQSVVDKLVEAEELYYLANGEYTMDKNNLVLDFALEPLSAASASTTYKLGSGSYASIGNINAWRVNDSHPSGTWGHEGYVDANFRKNSRENMITYWKFLLHEGTHPAERYCISKAEYEHGNRVCKALGGELTTGAARPRFATSNLNLYRLK